MGIINRSRTDGGEPAGTTVIAAGSKLVGDLALTDHLHVDGEIEGKIHSESEVAIGEQGRIQGELSARRVLISGRFEGNIEAQRLEIVTGGRVDGDVTVSELVIESGAQFNGNSRIREAQGETSNKTVHRQSSDQTPNKRAGSDKANTEETSASGTAKAG